MRVSIVAASLCLVGLTVVRPALSQDLSSRARDVVVTESAPIFLLPDANRQPLRVAKAGSVLTVLGRAGDWCYVEFQDPQFGPRAGYIQTKFLGINLIEPLDLSIPEAQVPVARPQNADRPIQDGITRAATQSPGQTTPGLSRGKVPTKYKWWSGALIGAGAYYLFSYVVVEPNETVCYFGSCTSTNTLRTAWLVMGSGLTVAGVGVLAAGVSKSHHRSPSVSFGPGGIVVRQTIDLSRKRLRTVPPQR